MSKPVDLTNYG